MSRTPWLLYDPQTLDIYAWPVNPHTDDGSHAVTKTPKYEVNAGMRQDDSGQDRIDNIIADGGQSTERLSYSGFVYSQAQLEALEAWASKDYDVILTDDLGREFSIIIEGFTLDRVRARNKTYKHSYKLTALVLSQL